LHERRIFFTFPKAHVNEVITRVSTTKEQIMSVAKVVEITSSSKVSFQDAIEKGVARANKSLKNVQGAWVQDQKVDVLKGKVVAYRVSMKVTFILA
jgi:dodecin